MTRRPGAQRVSALWLVAALVATLVATPLPGLGTRLSYDVALSGSVGDVSLYHSALAPDDIVRLAKPSPGAVYTYVLDANGNVTTEPGLTPTTYTYTLDGRVRSSTSGGVSHTYTLDGAGNRVADAVTGSTVALEWNPLSDLPQLMTATTTVGASTTRADYRYDPSGAAMLLTEGAATVSLGHDLLGSVTDTFTAAGAAGRAAAFEPFGGARTAVPGAPAAPTGPSPLLGFASMPASGTAGGSLAGVRVLDPAEGAFTSTDPVFMSSGPAWASPYTYANNSPARYTDPAGRDALDDAGQAIMGAGDAMSFGFTGWVRENNPWFDTAGAADYCSGWYTAGTYIGTAATLVTPAGLGLGVGTATMRMAARTGLARVEAFLARTGTSLLAKGGTLARALPAAARTATRELTTLARQAGTTARAGLHETRQTIANGARRLAHDDSGYIHWWDNTGNAASAEGGGDHIALALTENVDEFAASVGARHVMGQAAGEWQTTISAAAHDGSTAFSVSLDGVEGLEGSITRGAYREMRARGVSVAGRSPSWFDWEMYTLDKAGAWGRTTFYRGGNVVPNPFGKG